MPFQTSGSLRRSKRLTLPSQRSAYGSRSFNILPTELFDDVCAYLEPVDVLNLGCVNRRLASLTTSHSRIWRILYKNAGLPAIPTTAANIVSHKQVFSLTSRAGCSRCPTKTKQVNWRLLQRVCVKCTQLSEVQLWNKEFFEWVEEMKNFEAARVKERLNEIEEIKGQRHWDILRRFGAMNPPISEDILDECEGFERVCEPPVPITDRIFVNIKRLLAPQIRSVRVQETWTEWYIQLHTIAMEGIPKSWNGYMSMDVPSIDYSENVAGKDLNFIRWCRHEFLADLDTYQWSDAFPAFNVDKYLEEARRVLRAPYEKYVEAERDILNRMPHLKTILDDFKDNDCDLEDLQDIFWNVDEKCQAEKFEQLIQSEVLFSRLEELFHPNIFQTLPAVEIHLLGGTQWFYQNLDAFDYKFDSWNGDVMKASFLAWQDTIAIRITTVYRHITAKCSPKLFDTNLLDNQIAQLMGPYEWHYLSDLDPRAVLTVRGFLENITRLTNIHEGYPDYHGMRKKVAEIQSLLTEPAATFNEAKLFAESSLYFNRKCYFHTIGLGLIVEKFYVSKGLDFTTGFDLDDAGVIERREWQNKVDERLEAIAEALNKNYMLVIPPAFSARLKSVVNGSFCGQESDYVMAKALLMDVLPSNTLFGVDKCLKVHEDFLNGMANKMLENPRYQEIYFPVFESLWMADVRNR
ncbi:hypothetical protein BCR33DRAFT_861579 [Rhizoclosmatium globosum]|uniref:F-box domain-containing protein n=1 Tax=Rhizoclosmatium globosum TaxID=329046 RepID=A0A1Y2AHR7_9FUNG|nr:hypothetical protein BCR33DRAFT_861579 [Rhizoclosmatium globosum]|eukprot:ORY22143.1 hypothetical protein BCR33DRAFT_861579 [Rhizoclosmatium globosum]